MGYYSLYRIIKDIIHTIFGRKVFRLLLIILIALSIIFCLNSSVFALTTYVTPFNDNVDIPDELADYHYIITFYYNNGYYSFDYWISTTPFVVTGSNNPSGGGYLTCSGTNIKASNGYGSKTLSTTKSNLESKILESLSTINDSTTTSATIFTRTDKAKTEMFSNQVIEYDGVVYANANGKFTKNPYFPNADDVLDYDFNNLYVNMGDLSVDDVVYLHKLEVDRSFEADTGVVYYKQYVYKLNSNSDYYGITEDLVSYYSIPRSALNLFSDKEYLFVLNDNASSINATNGLYTDENAFDILHLVPENSVITPEKEQNDAIKGNSDAINNLSNTITSNDYDENQIKIDSSLSENINEDNYTNFITEIINSINNAITCDWNTVETVEIPLGFVDENITWKSDLLSSHIPDSLKLIINTFWMFLFGFYIFKFSLNLVNWLKSGEILDGKGFNSDEVITSNML